MANLQFKSMLKPMLWAAGVGVVINVILYFVGTSTGMISTTIPVTPDGQSFALPPVIIASIVPVFVAGLVYWLMSKWIGGYQRWFTILSVVLLVLSFASPFSVPDMPTSMAIILNLMHLVVGGAVLYFFRAAK